MRSKEKLLKRRISKTGLPKLLNSWNDLKQHWGSLLQSLQTIIAYIFTLNFTESKVLIEEFVKEYGHENEVIVEISKVLKVFSTALNSYYRMRFMPEDHLSSLHQSIISNSPKFSASYEQDFVKVSTRLRSQLKNVVECINISISHLKSQSEIDVNNATTNPSQSQSLPQISGHDRPSLSYPYQSLKKLDDGNNKTASNSSMETGPYIPPNTSTITIVTKKESMGEYSTPSSQGSGAHVNPNAIAILGSLRDLKKMLNALRWSIRIRFELMVPIYARLHSFRYHENLPWSGHESLLSQLTKTIESKEYRRLCHCDQVCQWKLSPEEMYADRSVRTMHTIDESAHVSWYDLVGSCRLLCLEMKLLQAFLNVNVALTEYDLVGSITSLKEYRRCYDQFYFLFVDLPYRCLLKQRHEKKVLASTNEVERNTAVTTVGTGAASTESHLHSTTEHGHHSNAHKRSPSPLSGKSAENALTPRANSNKKSPSPALVANTQIVVKGSASQSTINDGKAPEIISCRLLHWYQTFLERLRCKCHLFFYGYFYKMVTQGILDESQCQNRYIQSKIEPFLRSIEKKGINKDYAMSEEIANNDVLPNLPTFFLLCDGRGLDMSYDSSGMILEYSLYPECTLSNANGKNTEEEKKEAKETKSESEGKNNEMALFSVVFRWPVDLSVKWNNPRLRDKFARIFLDNHEKLINSNRYILTVENKVVHAPVTEVSIEMIEKEKEKEKLIVMISISPRVVAILCVSRKYLEMSSYRTKIANLQMRTQNPVSEHRLPKKSIHKEKYKNDKEEIIDNSQVVVMDEDIKLCLEFQRVINELRLSPSLVLWKLKN